MNWHWAFRKVITVYILGTSSMPEYEKEKKHTSFSYSLVTMTRHSLLFTFPWCPVSNRSAQREREREMLPTAAMSKHLTGRNPECDKSWGACTFPNKHRKHSLINASYVQASLPQDNGMSRCLFFTTAHEIHICQCTHAHTYTWLAWI